ncbi:MAG: bifunctional diguanylate cyclase/phosphodiesterase [Gammaproteobacteria bacterium]|nr:bifunctional diguanylate cyclase/phosphodiesterase [Gammaproteobacteria bacterium]
MSTDALTRLPDRAEFFSMLSAHLDACPEGVVGLIVVQLRRLRELNVDFGYDAADQVVVEVAHRIADCLRENDRMARIGAGEFALILPGLKNAGQPQLAANKIARECSEPLVIGGRDFRPHLALGVTMSPQHHSTVLGLLRCADQALSESRDTGNLITLFEERPGPEISLVGMERELEAAIDCRELDAVFQPKVELDSGAFVGVEMLTRWESNAGTVNPELLVEVAERSGLIMPLTVWGLNRALFEWQEWKAGLPDVGVAVNLSAKLLGDPEIPALISQSIRMWGIEPGRLTLEVTESALMADPESAMMILRAIHDLGVRLAIDDFGTGYSSLAYLKDLPVDQLKIDKSFVLNMIRDDGNRRIVQTVIDLARNLDLTVVAEGVEDEDTLDALTLMGCGHGQGYFIGKPMPAERLFDWFQNSTWELPEEPYALAG